ncbi:unnamed protein product [Adineta ricciae]|uniref:Uncharacterized protein n=1 Tax=Adineta ricciae TaxID=249248 RepID=A0A815PYW6_ADIRI|nr:unnamed protein product [Adineta ricciae]CAF1549813.1 unnamed protein product [Adineta ricciae]
MNTPRNEHTATLLLNGKVLVTGEDNNSPVVTAQLHDPLTNNWTLTASMSVPRNYHITSVLSNGKVLIAGRNSSNTSSELYDSETNSWKTTANMNVAGVLN